MYSLFRNLLKKSGQGQTRKGRADPKKNNLGRKKQRARYIRDIGVIKTIVNRELNLLFTRKTNPIKEIVVEDLSTRMKVHFGKKVEPTTERLDARIPTGRESDIKQGSLELK